MDNLKALYEKKEYELIIKLTRSSSNVDDLFYCLSSYMALLKLDDAINLIKTKRKILETHLPIMMKTHIELLCMLARYNEAFDEIEYYKNLPYYSQEAEEVIRELPHILLDYQKKSFAHNGANEDDIIKDLTSNENMRVIGALDLLGDKDLTPYYIYISKILSTYPTQHVRSFALLLLVHRQVNKLFRFKHFDKIIEVNPAKLNPPFIDDNFKQLNSKLQEAYKDSSLTSNAMQILSSYLIYIYPDTIDLSDPDLIEALRVVTSEMMKIELKGEVNQNCRHLIDKIKAAMEDF